MRLRDFLLPAIVVVLAAIGCTAQSQTAPTAQAEHPQAQQSTADDDDISGMYAFLREGEFVQISLEAGKVTGFVSRYGDSDGDKGAFLDQFFSKAELAGKNLSFTTKPVHDLWYEFVGEIDRGTAKTVTDEGYRVLRGKLTQFTTDSSKKVLSKTRQVEFKSFPKDEDEAH